MEDYDDLTAGPDSDGSMNLGYNSWRELPSELFGFAPSLVSLDLRHNRLEEISSGFGELVVLRDLNVSSNRVERIDPAIGRCVRLRSLDVSRNRLAEIPGEISSCLMLESLRCDDNRIESLPGEISDLRALAELRLDGNRLVGIPTRLSLIPTLKEITCRGNDRLETVPAGVRGKSEMVLWCLRLLYDYEMRTEAKAAACEESEGRARDAAERRLRLRERADEVADRVGAAEEDRPGWYIGLKARLGSIVNRS